MERYIILSLLITGLIINFIECKENARNETADTFIFTTIVTPPYMMESSEMDDEMMFEGFLVDLWDRMNEQLNIAKYKIQKVADDRYGILNNGTGEWNGMVGEIIRGEADAALAPLTMTTSRAAVIDFVPYLELGGAILLRKDLNIKTVQELIGSEVPYGCIEGGSTQSMFANAAEGILMEMNSVMTSQESSVFEKSAEEAAARAIREDYAFIGEETMLDYLASVHCDLTTIELDAIPKVTHALALEQNSRYTAEFTDAIESLKSDGTLDELYSKWWKTGQSECDDMSNDMDDDMVDPVDDDIQEKPEAGDMDEDDEKSAEESEPEPDSEPMDNDDEDSDDNEMVEGGSTRQLIDIISLLVSFVAVIIL